LLYGREIIGVLIRADERSLEMRIFLLGYKLEQGLI
jgi:hypothetical protein